MNKKCTVRGCDFYDISQVGNCGAPRGNSCFATPHEVLVLRKLVNDLADALRELRDWQNGVPLPSYEKGWKEAMGKSQILLARLGK